MLGEMSTFSISIQVATFGNFSTKLLLNCCHQHINSMTLKSCMYISHANLSWSHKSDARLSWNKVDATHVSKLVQTLYPAWKFKEDIKFNSSLLSWRFMTEFQGYMEIKFRNVNKLSCLCNINKSTNPYKLQSIVLFKLVLVFKLSNMFIT